MEQAATFNATAPLRPRGRYGGVFEKLDPILDAKFPWVEVVVLGSAAHSPVLYYFIKSLPFILPVFGWEVLNCSEKDFLLNNLYGLEAFDALFMITLMPITFIIGWARIKRKKKWGALIFGATVLLIAWNAWLTYASLEWFWTTSNKAIITNAQTQMADLAAAQETYKAQYGEYAADTASLGRPFGFNEIGTLAVTSASAVGFEAEARHACLVKTVRYETGKGVITK